MMPSPHKDITRDESLRVTDPVTALRQIEEETRYVARMAECDAKGHITTLWLMMGFRRYLCARCGRTFAERPREQEA